eukprot:163182-Rhodomonas_salina.1
MICSTAIPRREAQGSCLLHGRQNRPRSAEPPRSCHDDSDCIMMTLDDHDDDDDDDDCGPARSMVSAERVMHEGEMVAPAEPKLQP